jgi:Heavy-metal-associated domain
MSWRFTVHHCLLNCCNCAKALVLKQFWALSRCASLQLTNTRSIIRCTVHCGTAGGKGDAPVEHTLAVPTMTSAAAAGRIESALLSLPGVAGVSTSLVTSRVKVLVLASTLVSGSGSSSSGSAAAAASVGVRALLECVQGLGFEATVEKRASDVAMMGASQVCFCQHSNPEYKLHV